MLSGEQMLHADTKTIKTTTKHGTFNKITKKKAYYSEVYLNFLFKRLFQILEVKECFTAAQDNYVHFKTFFTDWQSKSVYVKEVSPQNGIFFLIIWVQKGTHFMTEAWIQSTWILVPQMFQLESELNWFTVGFFLPLHSVTDNRLHIHCY